ncbi:MAG: VWA domain-containing protein [Bacteroidales bacterium]|nr:VWA domain-containing protein [Bacteroidales bacterium]
MDNFRFANPNVLWLLVVVVLLILLYQWRRYQSKKSLSRFGEVNMLRPLMDGVSKQKPRMKFVLQMVALVCLIVAGARPQFGSKLQNVKKEGIEVMVCLDISNSMLAEDIAPNRLEKSKRMLSRMLDQMENNQVGLVVFAGDAVVQLPITNDYVSAKMFLESISPENISVQGTAIGAAINLAVRSFTPREESSKAIILITDAENHEDDASGAAAAAYEKGIPTHVIGVGSTQGTVIPDGSGRRNSPRKDNTGNPITTRLDETIARQVAEAGHGIYAHADNSNSAITSVVESLNQMQTTELESHVYAEYDDQFFWFVLLAFFCLLIDIILVDRANPMFSKIKLFE